MSKIKPFPIKYEPFVLNKNYNYENQKLKLEKEDLIKKLTGKDPNIIWNLENLINNFYLKKLAEITNKNILQKRFSDKLNLSESASQIYNSLQIKKEPELVYKYILVMLKMWVLNYKENIFSDCEYLIKAKLKNTGLFNSIYHWNDAIDSIIHRLKNVSIYLKDYNFEDDDVTRIIVRLKEKYFLFYINELESKMNLIRKYFKR